jgi:hypothetical protein
MVRPACLGDLDVAVSLEPSQLTHNSILLYLALLSDRIDTGIYIRILLSPLPYPPLQVQ